MSGVGIGAGAWINLNPLNNGTIVRGIAAMPSGVSTYNVTFPTALGTSNYVIQCTVSNLIDATPRHLNPTVTVKSSTGFTFVTQQTTDTANYKIEYIIIKL